MTALLVRRIDGRLIIELPGTLASQAQLKDGDMLEAVDVHQGGFSVKVMPDIKASQMRLGLAAMDSYAETYATLQAAEQVMVEHEWVLKELAR